MKDTKIPYLLKGTPATLLVLGAGFVMASSADIRAALGMGVAVLLSMLLSSIVVSAIHKIIPDYAKMPAYLLIITGFVSIISMLMQVICPGVVNMLGVHLAALAVSAVVYRDCEEVADHNGEVKSITTALITGAFLTVIMLVCALIREVLGNASFFGLPIAFLEDYKIKTLAGAFGGYLVLAIVVAVINKVTGLTINKHHDEEVIEEAAEAVETVAAPEAVPVVTTEVAEATETVEATEVAIEETTETATEEKEVQ